MSTAGEPVVIVGAGIAGLATALALARIGQSSIVLERAPELSGIGAGLQLSPNAAAVLDRLEVGGPVAAAASEATALAIGSGRTGRALAHLDLAGYSRRHGLQPYRVIHRADLVAALAARAQALPAVRLHTAAAVEAVRWDGAGVSVTTTDGREYSGRALIGADGVWSAIRAIALDLPPAVPSGRSAWRATLPADRAAGLQGAGIGLWLGANAHLVHYPLRRGDSVNLVAVVRDGFAEATWDGADAPGVLRDRFGDWHPDLRRVVGSAGGWRRWPLFERRPERYHVARPVALVGDAWHASLPFMAQGAAMAIEDAAVLAHHWRAEPDPVRALDRFVADRHARTARLVAAARRNGWVYHLDGPMARVRDRVLRAMPQRRLMARFDWIYTWKPPAVA